MALPSIVREIVANPLLYLGLLLAWVAKLYIDATIKKGVDHRFNKELEEHKQQLEVATERAKTEFQRELSNFSLYATKRHQAAETVYAAIRVAHGHISNLFGISFGLSFEEYNSDDIREYMSAHEIPRGKQEEVLKSWTSDRKAAINILAPYLRMVRVQEAERKFMDAKNATYLNELYFPDEVIAPINEFFAVCAEWLTYAEFPKDPGEKWRPDRKKLDAALEHIHAVLRNLLNPPPRSIEARPAAS